MAGSKSRYREKQGRARLADGMQGGRTRIAPTSPFHVARNTDPNHRLAVASRAGLAHLKLCQEQGLVWSPAAEESALAQGWDSWESYCCAGDVT